MAKTGSVPTPQLLLPASQESVTQLGNAGEALTQMQLPPAVTAGERPPSPALRLPERCCRAAGTGRSLYREHSESLLSSCEVVQAVLLSLFRVCAGEKLLFLVHHMLWSGESVWGVCVQ